MILSLLALATAAAAPPPPKAPPKAPPAAALRGAAAMKALGMSDAGIAVLRTQSRPDPDARAMLAKRETLRGQIVQAAGANPFDGDAVAALLRESSALEGTLRGRNEDRIVATLKALPPADRPIYARAVFGPPPPPAAPVPPALRP